MQSCRWVSISHLGQQGGILILFLFFVQWVEFCKAFEFNRYDPHKFVIDLNWKHISQNMFCACQYNFLDFCKTWLSTDLLLIFICTFFNVPRSSFYYYYHCYYYILLLLIIIITVVIIIIIVLLIAGLIQSSAKAFTWDLRQIKRRMSHYLGGKYLLVIILLEIAAFLLPLRALFVICEQYLWVLFSAFPVLMLYQEFGG